MERSEDDCKTTVLQTAGWECLFVNLILRCMLHSAVQRYVRYKPSRFEIKVRYQFAIHVFRHFEVLAHWEQRFMPK
jgi:hypothetical protein